MLLGFVGLGAVVETAYLPAIRNLFDESPRCSGFDVQPVKQPEGVTRCASLAELLSQPLDTLFITTASLNHLEVLEQAIASPVSRIVVEKPIVATLPQIEKLKSLLELPGVASRVLALCWLDFPIIFGQSFPLQVASVSIMGREKESWAVIRWNS